MEPFYTPQIVQSIKGRTIPATLDIFLHEMRRLVGASLGQAKWIQEVSLERNDQQILENALTTQHYLKQLLAMLDRQMLLSLLHYNLNNVEDPWQSADQDEWVHLLDQLNQDNLQ